MIRKELNLRLLFSYGAILILAISLVACKGDQILSTDLTEPEGHDFSTVPAEPREYPGWISSVNPRGAYRAYYPGTWRFVPRVEHELGDVNIYVDSLSSNFMSMSSSKLDEPLANFKPRMDRNHQIVFDNPKYVPGSYVWIRKETENSGDLVWEYSYRMKNEACPDSESITHSRLVLRDPENTITEFSLLKIQMIGCALDLKFESVRSLMIERLEYW